MILRLRIKRRWRAVNRRPSVASPQRNGRWWSRRSAKTVVRNRYWSASSGSMTFRSVMNESTRTSMQIGELAVICIRISGIRSPIASALAVKIGGEAP
jgi:hypothetical protein